MAASVPVVVSATGGLADIADHGITGLKCYPDNALSLAEQLITILQKPRFAQQGRAGDKSAQGFCLAGNSQADPQYIPESTDRLSAERLADSSLYTASK